MGGALADFPVVITRVNDLYPLKISDLESVDLNGIAQRDSWFIARR
jgi:hypothetical protein